MDGPRGRQPYSSGGDRTNRGNKGFADNRGNGANPRFGRREQRPANPQTVQRRTVHYQVVTMDDEEWGDALENRLNSLGHDGWRLVAIDEGRQYVFIQAD